MWASKTDSKTVCSSSNVIRLFVTLRADEAAVQCIIIAPVCLFVYLGVCGSVTTIT